MKLAYADPPYPGQARKHYKNHPDYAGEVDHELLAIRLADYDGYVLHTSSVALPYVQSLFPDARVGVWVKPFAAFKRNVPVAYAWEPVLIKAVRKPAVGGLIKPLRDYIAEPITMKRGLTGVKPEKVVWWCLEMAGIELADEIEDLFPGTGAVTRAWESWKNAHIALGETKCG